MTRQQKGLQPLAPSPSQQQLSQISPAERAKISSLDDQAPISLAIRAQINSGQVLSGNAKQRTVAIGQQLLTMGYGGIWQHPDFNYDSGFTGSGQEEVGTHAGNSFHKYDEALDIGVQANGHYKLEQLYQYLLKNKARFGVAELFYDPDGTRGNPRTPRPCRYPGGKFWNYAMNLNEQLTQQAYESDKMYEEERQAAAAAKKGTDKPAESTPEKKEEHKQSGPQTQ